MNGRSLAECETWKNEYNYVMNASVKGMQCEFTKNRVKLLANQ